MKIERTAASFCALLALLSTAGILFGEKREEPFFATAIIIFVSGFLMFRWLEISDGDS